MASRFVIHSRNVATLERAGFTLPTEYTELRERLAEYKSIGTPVFDRLVSAITEGNGENVADLRGAAAGEHAARDLDNKVLDALHGKLIATYADHAAEIYRVVAEKFDQTAKLFTKAAETVNVELPATEVLDLDAKTQAQWKAAADHAAALTDLLGVLRAAAHLAGIELPGYKDSASSASRLYAQDRMELGLAVDSAGIHCRRLWEGWSAEGRCAPWSGTHATGAKIRAVELADYEPTRRPKSLVERRRLDGTVIIHDPEDGELPATNDDGGAWKVAGGPGEVTATVSVTHA